MPHVRAEGRETNLPAEGDVRLIRATGRRQTVLSFGSSMVRLLPPRSLSN